MIYLVRHGQTDWNIEKKTQGHTDISLNENGRNQARMLSVGIASLGIDRIVSSDLSRARETAEILNDKIGCKIELDSRLREINYGVLEGVCRDNLTPKDWEIFNTTPEALNAEPMISVFSRIKSCFDELREAEGNILVVTHGGALRMIMYYASSPESFERNEYVKFCQNAKIKNAAVFKWNSTMDSLQPIEF